MTLDQFWNLIENIHLASGGNMDRKCDLLDKQLRQLSLDEVRSFHTHFDDCRHRAYDWGLWAAAYIIGGGCSDDSFSDFRSTLISMGRRTYERALADPQSLADVDYEAVNAHYEGYQYVATQVERNLSDGGSFPASRPHPKEPSGTMWEEDKVADLYPRLAQKYGYKG